MQHGIPATARVLGEGRFFGHQVLGSEHETGIGARSVNMTHMYVLPEKHIARLEKCQPVIAQKLHEVVHVCALEQENSYLNDRSTLESSEPTSGESAPSSLSLGGHQRSAKVHATE